MNLSNLTLCHFKPIFLSLTVVTRKARIVKKIRKSKIFITKLFIIIFIAGCQNNSKVVDEKLMAEIDKYIEFCENRAKEKSTFKETNIYIVYGSSNGKEEIIEIFQYLNYSQKNLDGHLVRGDNTIFFYDSNEKLVNVEKLNHELSKEVPDENSDEAQVGYNPIIWKFLLIDGQLKKVDNSLE
ncbi:hypothetical protein LV716_17325 [Flagellimonas sp. HMM57]|uniref:hypothetical protein n=1 Tax=unclassified Flagellimonas TaxID=2644544 RepID=UPI0013D3B1EA|nr:MULTISPECIES: hypothetical protein [unclassified Flagellimonas]UII76004.1 hypothetical protein LV716_17325 [Flagellimonas sp. HMM57]